VPTTEAATVIEAKALRPLRNASPEYATTEALKAHVEQLRLTRTPFFLSAEDLDRIFRWKLRGQYERTLRRRAMNTPATYCAVTEAVFKVIDPDPNYESAVRLGLLIALPGIGVGVASAILALTEPQRYCVIDFRGWRTLFGKERRSFLVPDYQRYRTAVATLAAELGWAVQETDLAIWEYDKRRGQGAASPARDGP
jgi:hypothetical protein